jgi:hypothetical protein
MSRPLSDDPSSQLLKYRKHSEANKVLKHYLINKNLIASYVIAFSLLEDRIRAMYFVFERDINLKESQSININGSISTLVRKLKDAELIDREICIRLFNAIEKRNPLMHDAMWKLDAFVLDDILEVIELKKILHNNLNKLKRALARG